MRSALQTAGIHRFLLYGASNEKSTHHHLEFNFCAVGLEAPIACNLTENETHIPMEISRCIQFTCGKETFVVAD